jgi:hypothetical protein
MMSGTKYMKPSFPPDPDMKPSGGPIRPPKILFVMMALGFMVSGCNSIPNATLVANHNVVYVPPASAFNCPLAPLPQSFATNSDVARTLNTTYGNNVTCHNNMNALHNDLLNQKKVFNGGKK